MKKSNNFQISVVIPVYNEQSYLAACLESLTKQTLTPLEIIVVDNNSTDATAKIAKAFNVTLITEKKQGIIPTRNTGFDKTKGDIIARTDADTVVPEDWTKRLVTHFANEKVVGVTGPARYGKKVTPQVATAIFSLNTLFFKNQGLFGPNMAIRKSAWNKAKDSLCTNEADIHEDLDLSIHLNKLGKIAYDPKIVVDTSIRRIKNPKSFFVDYVLKWGRTLKQHSSDFVLKV